MTIRGAFSVPKELDLNIHSSKCLLEMVLKWKSELEIMHVLRTCNYFINPGYFHSFGI